MTRPHSRETQSAMEGDVNVSPFNVVRTPFGYATYEIERPDIGCIVHVWLANDDFEKKQINLSSFLGLDDWMLEECVLLAAYLLSGARENYAALMEQLLSGWHL